MVIGTTGPGAKLDVAGGIKMANDAAACTGSNAGTMRWTGTALEFCKTNSWLRIRMFLAVGATGGTITDIDGYRIHTFTSNGTFTPDSTMNVEVLVVAGGGAGGVLYTSLIPQAGILP